MVTLPTRQRAMSYVEIAERLGVSPGTVWQIEQRALKKMRRFLASFAPDYPDAPKRDARRRPQFNEQQRADIDSRRWTPKTKGDL